MAWFIYPKVLLGVMFPLYIQGQVTAQVNKTYLINLDAAPSERWVALGKDFPQLKPFVKYLIESVVPKEVLPLVQVFVRKLDHYLPDEYVQELQGLADATGTPVEDLVMYNLIYDISAHCTSIVCQDPEGHIWHARNLDYDFKDILTNTTVLVEFQRNNKTLYRSVSFAGYIGLFTGERMHAYTMSIDERYTHSSGWLNALVALLDHNASTIFVASRRIIDSAESYADAVEQFSGAQFLAPMYIILGGAHPGEGAVLTRQRVYTEDIWLLDPFNGRWFVVETNYDHWLPPPKSDDRRDPAIRFMERMGQKNISAANLLEILMSPNVSQSTTLYSTVFSASQPNVYLTHVWT